MNYLSYSFNEKHKRPTSEFKLSANELISIFDNSDSDSDADLSSSSSTDSSHIDEVSNSKETVNTENTTKSFDAKSEVEDKNKEKSTRKQNDLNDLMRSINLLFQSVCSFITLNCYLLMFLITFLETSEAFLLIPVLLIQVFVLLFFFLNASKR